MNEYVTCKQMKQLEEKADAAGLSYYTMMENAGKAVADVIIDKSGILVNKYGAALGLLDACISQLDHFLGLTLTFVSYQ